MKADLIKRLQAAAKEAWDIDTRYDSVPVTDWSCLMEEAANALQEVEDDEPYNEDPYAPPAQYTHGPRKPKLYLVNDDPNHSRGISADQRDA